MSMIFFPKPFSCSYYIQNECTVYIQEIVKKYYLMFMFKHKKSLVKHGYISTFLLIFQDLCKSCKGFFSPVVYKLPQITIKVTFWILLCVFVNRFW